MGGHFADATEDQIASMLRFRRARAELFDPSLVSNPAWDILLQLFAAKLARRPMKLGDLTPVAPRSTLARWAFALEDKGLVSCRRDGTDLQDVRIEISGAGAARMSNLFRIVRGLALAD